MRTKARDYGATLRAFGRAKAFGEELRDFAGSVDPVYATLADEYERFVAPTLLRRDSPVVGKHNLIDLIRKPPDNINALGLDETDVRIVGFSRRLNNPDLRDALANNATYLIALKPDSNEYEELVQKFGVSACKRFGEIPTPKDIGGEKRIDEHGRTPHSLD